MVFSSTVFIFLFLPIVLGVYFLIPTKAKNFFLLFSSLFFYAWGEFALVILMMCSIITNYIIGILISKFSSSKGSKINLAVGITINLLFLFYYKYIGFIISSLSDIGIHLNFNTSEIVLPVGISFFTFQSISYLVDVYKKSVPAQKNVINLGMYISLFPQLIAGPIVRYIDISKEIANRQVTVNSFKDGSIRFITGFAKKVIIANNMGLIADKVFEIPVTDLSTPLTWIGVLCYTMQIYYDFSGYSDMAIGLGKMFGFTFKENFNYPYVALSVQDFWRRWHISLSTWFRDYLYIPLGGNRKGKYRTFVNLFIVFFLTGLWHGASWNFIVWGLFHGCFLIFERISPLKLSSKWNLLRRFYLIMVVLVGWVLFRSENLAYAIDFIIKMFSLSSGINNYPYVFINPYVVFVFCIGIIFSTPLWKNAKTFFTNSFPKLFYIKQIKYAFYLIVFIFTILELAQATYNPFIYYRF